MAADPIYLGKDNKTLQLSMLVIGLLLTHVQIYLKHKYTTLGLQKKQVRLTKSTSPPNNNQNISINPGLPETVLIIPEISQSSKSTPRYRMVINRPLMHSLPGTEAPQFLKMKLRKTKLCRAHMSWVPKIAIPVKK